MERSIFKIPKKRLFFCFVIFIILFISFLLVNNQPQKIYAVQSIPRGLVVQEGGADVAMAGGVTMAATRWPANYGFGPIDRELEKAKQNGIKLIIGWCLDNDGRYDCTPSSWERVCWGSGEGSANCGPNYAKPEVQNLIFQSIRELGRRYDGHPQVVAIMANIGMDGERRFCKRPFAGDPCWEAYARAGLTRQVWEKYVRDIARVYAESFQKTPVLWHYSGFGFHAAEIERDVKLGVEAGFGLMSSGLYPAMCSGNSMGGQCNPLEPIMNDWQIPSVYPNHPLAMEQSLAYTGGQAALAWLWAVTHNAWQIHAQRQTLQSSIGTEWRETAEYMLENPTAAIWVAWHPDQSLCSKCGRPYYCPEQGNWQRNILKEEGNMEVRFNLETNDYRGWVTRKSPIKLTTNINGPVEIRVVLADGSQKTWKQANGTLITLEEGYWVHRIEVRPTSGSPACTPPPDCLEKCRGDANCDGKITLLDFEIWRQQAKDAKPIGEVNFNADFNQDGEVSDLDYIIWLGNFK